MNALYGWLHQEGHLKERLKLPRLRPRPASRVPFQCLTILTLGLSERLRHSVATTNAIESLISRTRHVKRNVKRWRSGQMVLRWTAAALLEAVKGFRRLKGHKDMPKLVARRPSTVGTGKAQIRRSIASNSRRVKWLSVGPLGLPVVAVVEDSGPRPRRGADGFTRADAGGVRLRESLHPSSPIL